MPLPCADDCPRHDEGERPVLLDEEARDEGAEDVADGGVGVPDAEDEALLAAPEPVGHHRHHAGPARRLKKSRSKFNIIFSMSSRRMVFNYETSVRFQVTCTESSSGSKPMHL